MPGIGVLREVSTARVSRMPSSEQQVTIARPPEEHSRGTTIGPPVNEGSGTDREVVLAGPGGAVEPEHETVTEPLIDLRHHGAVVIDLGVVVDVRPVDSAVALLHQLHDFGVQVAVFSQTGDAQAVLDTGRAR